jgi:hypothetical protein
MDRVEGSHLQREERPRSPEDAVVHADQVESTQRAPSRGERKLSSGEKGAEYFRLRQRTCDQRSPASQVTTQYLGLRFSNRELDDRRRVDVGRRYHSALVAAQPLQNGGRCLDPLGQGQWLGQVVEVFRSGFDLSGRPHQLQGRTLRHGGEACHRSASVSDLDDLSLFDQSEKLARPLPQFADPDRSHVLHIAH